MSFYAWKINWKLLSRGFIILAEISDQLKSILTEPQLEITIKRLAHQVLENHVDLANTVMIGLQPRGIYLSDRIVDEIKKDIPAEKIQYGKLDITFYRDDIGKELHIANRTDIPFSIEGKNVNWSTMCYIREERFAQRWTPCLTLVVPKKWNYVFWSIAASAGNYLYILIIPANQLMQSFHKK